MTEDQQKELLSLIRAGHDVESAAAKLSLSMAQIRAAGSEFDQQIKETFRGATAKLRSRVLEMALDSDDAKLLAALLEKRESAQSEAFGDDVVERYAREDPRQTARAFLHGIGEACELIGIHVTLSLPGETVLRIKTPADSELLRRLYPDSFSDDRQSFRERFAAMVPDPVSPAAGDVPASEEGHPDDEV
ncbi:hypothetical protein [Roseibium salinum]|uniref:Uncharacterized protein n=1 Tax=Roseibium salinum TaxID=1604349 RepID=A0ABT3QYG4_9HYPH|nr:hypothetical protein [Roseibium sp. DSM 29163]MCX2721971.1 hypothetical protein [Roseibium sp. DSM 29163]